MLFEPEDVLLFRDSRPFTAGEDFRAQGAFPPLPNPIVGSLRAAVLQTELQRRGKTFADYARADAALADLIAVLGQANSLNNVHFAGPLICRFTPDTNTASMLFALPADVLGECALRPQENPLPGWRKPLTGLSGGRTLPMAVLPPSVTASATTSSAAKSVDWLEEEALSAYLLGSPCIDRRLELSNLTTSETLTGLQLQSMQRAAVQGKFYNVEVQRPQWTPEQAVGLLVRVHIPDPYLLPEGYVPLGGEGRSMFVRSLAGYTPLLDQPAWRDKVAGTIVTDGGRFRLYLATPAVFAQGLLPDESALRSPAFSLLAVAAGKPLLVGGWDLAAGAPRPLRRAVPAGTVYYGQLTNPTLETAYDLLDRFHLQTYLQSVGSPSLHRGSDDESAFRAQMGYGLTLVGAWTQFQS